jgi:hypothetical protein
MSSAPFNFAALPATFAELPPVEGMPQGCAWCAAGVPHSSRAS